MSLSSLAQRVSRVVVFVLLLCGLDGVTTSNGSKTLGPVISELCESSCHGSLGHKSTFCYWCTNFLCVVFSWATAIRRTEVSEDPESLATAGVRSLNIPGQINVDSPCASVEKKTQQLHTSTSYFS